MISTSNSNENLNVKVPKRVPVPLLCYSIFLIGASSWWFIQLFASPEKFLVPMNIFYSITKMSVLISGIGIIMQRTWAVYLYLTTYCITVIIFFAGSAYKNSLEQVPTIVIFSTLIIFTSLIFFMFYKYRKNFK